MPLSTLFQLYQSVLMVEETGENHQVTDKLYHMLIIIVLYRVHLACAELELTTLVVIGIDCIGSYKSNYHTITTTTDSIWLVVQSPKYIYFTKTLCLLSMYNPPKDNGSLYQFIEIIDEIWDVCIAKLIEGAFDSCRPLNLPHLIFSMLSISCPFLNG